jgi:hypothetical protein
MQSRRESTSSTRSPMALLGPLDVVPMDASVAKLPKVELHLHGEADGRLDRILARREGKCPFDWANWARRLHAQIPPGMPRLQRLRADRRRTAEEVEAERCRIGSTLCNSSSQPEYP